MNLKNASEEGKRKMKKQSKKRLNQVKEELKLAPHYKYTIENDMVENALNKLQKKYMKMKKI